MSQREDLKKLQEITQLLLDGRLQRLRSAAEARDRSLGQMAGLRAAATTADLPVVTAGKVALSYQIWVDHRRAELNTVIARQTAEWMNARAEASLAFGRDQALRGVRDRER